MSLPNGFLDELRARASLTSIVGRKVTWDRRKSNPGRGDWWAPCPFHQEKSSSFHVIESKGFYKCFGCGASGDAITFLRELENMSFMEAVETLAREAGMEMPARDSQAAERDERRRTLVDVTEAAAKWFSAQLSGGRAAAARDYLKSRGMTGETAKAFGVGFAPDDRGGLQEHLAAKGFPLEDMIASGVLAKADDGRVYPRFRDRIMFPIRDPRGRCISFGGRAMQKDARAKYLNGPESPLFDKSRNLYNLDRARSAAGKAGRLIVAEGYMDVIALAQAGFEEAVAPLGTAVTEMQLQMMWRASPEPIIALDGDKAGIRAAERVIDLALPHLGPERSLRFCVMPEGLDPDDLIRKRGREAMEEALAASVPLIEMLWRRETQEKVFDTPERRAALDARLAEIARQIPDRRLRRHYVEALAERRAALFGLPYQPGETFAPAASAPAAPVAGPDFAPDYGSDFAPEAGYAPDYVPDMGPAPDWGPGYPPDFAPDFDPGFAPGMAEPAAAFAPAPQQGYGQGQGQGRRDARGGAGRSFGKDFGKGRGRDRGRGGPRARFFDAPEGPAPQTASSALARLAAAGSAARAAEAGAVWREAAILACALAHPDAALALEEDLAAAPFVHEGRARVRDALVDALAEYAARPAGATEPGAFRAAVDAALGADCWAMSGAAALTILPKAMRAGADPAAAREALAETLERHATLLSAIEETEEAARSLSEGEGGEDLTHRLAAAARALNGEGAAARREEADEGDAEAARRLRDFPIPRRSGRKG